tara:strand:- start:2065 stop:3120 length:1056 start_codon:yes stop_codon:yes gene_type:complete
MTQATTASKIGSEKLKINADNIKSVLTKNTKIISRLKAFKAKTIFKAKEAKKIAAEEKALELTKPKKKIKPESSPLKGGSMLDKLMEAAVLILGGYLLNTYTQVFKTFKEPIMKAFDFLKGIVDGFKSIVDFITGKKSEQDEIEANKDAVDADLKKVQDEQGEIDSMTKKGLSEMDTAQSEVDLLDPDEIDKAADELNEKEEDEEDIDEEGEEGVEVEGVEVEDASELGPVDESREEVSPEDVKEGVVESMQENPEVPKMNEGGESGKAGDGGSNIKDSIPTLLTPGEFIFKRKIAEAIGYDRLNEINALQPGSVTQKKLDDVAMLNKGKKNRTKTIIVNKTQVVQTTVTV